MSNERIDLTQFEGTIAEGKWHEHIHEPKEDGYERVADIMVSGVVAPPYTLQTNEGHTFATVEMGDLTAHLPLFMMVPDLIVELKRCYEELDEANKEGEAVWNVLENWDICTDDYSMHDLYNNLDEKYARDNEGRIILKELYSYTEEDGWQRKEPASK